MLVRPGSNSRPPAWQPDAQPTEPLVRGWSDPAKNLKLHKFPKKHETKRRRPWINFVLVKRAKWTFTPTSHLCSEHFRPEDFESQFSAIPGTSFVGRRSLKNAFFFLIETSERHTATDLVNFVYYPTGFVWSNRLHQGFKIVSPKIKLKYTPFLHRDLRYMLCVFLEGVLLFTPLLERAFVL